MLWLRLGRSLSCTPPTKPPKSSLPPHRHRGRQPQLRGTLDWLNLESLCWSCSSTLEAEGYSQPWTTPLSHPQAAAAGALNWAVWRRQRTPKKVQALGKKGFTGLFTSAPACLSKILSVGGRFDRRQH
ncbi:hypothetical protein MN608_06393 [Microdochium nivale]|nr:hypothetical protein MN608_06393 [Microdochium nivale]